MKNKIKSIVMLLLILVITVELQSQEKNNFSVQSTEVLIGWYIPSLDHWNKNYFPNRIPTNATIEAFKTLGLEPPRSQRCFNKKQYNEIYKKIAIKKYLDS